MIEAANKEKVIYSIAGLNLELLLPHGRRREELLPSFESFYMGSTSVKKKICGLEVSFETAPELEQEAELRSDISLVWGERFCFYELRDSYVTTIKSEVGEGVWQMRSSKDFKQSSIYLLNEKQAIAEVLSWFAMVAFGQSSLGHRTVLIHASVVVCQEKGYAFLGKSGTGKSTHSRLWLEHIEGTKLLNDDNPAVRIEENEEVFVYGTPWSGKTPCYENKGAKLQALVRLKQAANNRFSKRSGTSAFVSLLPSCTALRWSKTLFEEMNSIVETIVNKVMVAELECLPNVAAAKLCYEKTTE